ncbi:hypothetical protein Hypma_002351 [Hypsizygus marmoreus]|uniref:Uncharacterized protein n=1 Tax=Hypsizygus marmoreus TaxID=39966 RepID=A0A369J606_HYPMA|nr:hypothetical protein Hypma_002351 [Hypsizygus marmoreus]
MLVATVDALLGFYSTLDFSLYGVYRSCRKGIDLKLCSPDFWASVLARGGVSLQKFRNVVLVPVSILYCLYGHNVFHPLHQVAEEVVRILATCSYFNLSPSKF